MLKGRKEEWALLGWDNRKWVWPWSLTRPGEAHTCTFTKWNLIFCLLFCVIWKRFEQQATCADTWHNCPKIRHCQMAGGTDLGPQSPVSGTAAFWMASSERGELAGTLSESSWKSATLLQLLFSHKLTDNVKRQRGPTLRPRWDKMALRGGWCHLAICIFRQLQRTIPRCRHWPCGTAVLRVEATHTQMQTNHKRTDSFAVWVFKKYIQGCIYFILNFRTCLQHTAQFREILLQRFKL